MSHSPDPGRRRFLTLKRRDSPPPLRPPWTDEAAVTDRCTRCGDCLTACPEGILTAGAGGFPEIDFRAGSGECTFCGDCAAVCGEGVFGPTTETPIAATAAIGDACLAHQGVMCQSCGDACPERAIRFRLTRGTAPQPDLDPGACSGCGACVSVCPADAVSVRPREGIPA